MKLIVTVGNFAGQTEELVFDLPDPITWLGVEVETPEGLEAISKTGRTTIVRIPFTNHETGIHTMCQLNGEVMEVPFQ